jgi:endoglucanase
MSPIPSTTKSLPKIGPAQIALLEELSNAVSVSGDEREVRKIVIQAVRPYVDDLRVDAMGNVLVTCKSSVKNPLRVMLDAHMDEVGFMIVEDEGEGIYSFEVVGGVDERQLPGKPVWVGKDRLPGVIGAKPIHLVEKGEAHSAIPVSSLKVDLGPANAGRVSPGDYGTFATRFQRSGPSLMGKALDDRVGVATLIELVRRHPANIELVAAFTVQEELGLRGAKIAATSLHPDIAFAIDSTPAFDLPTAEDEENTVYNCKLDGGPAIYLADAGTISDPRLIRFLTATAEKYGIQYQFRQPGGGGTDAGAIHKVLGGIPSVSISIPGRYAHSAVLISRITDWQNTLQLIFAALPDISPEILASDRK